jgi:predicted dinucleotide-binding enzyme
VLALAYGAAADVVSQHATQLAGKVVVDITNPVDFATFDDLAVSAGTSAAQLIAALVPSARPQGLQHQLRRARDRHDRRRHHDRSRRR